MLKSGCCKPLPEQLWRLQSQQLALVASWGDTGDRCRVPATGAGPGIPLAHQAAVSKGEPLPSPGRWAKCFGWKQFAAGWVGLFGKRGIKAKGSVFSSSTVMLPTICFSLQFSGNRTPFGWRTKGPCVETWLFSSASSPLQCRNTLVLYPGRKTPFLSSQVREELLFCWKSDLLCCV